MFKHTPPKATYHMEYQMLHAHFSEKEKETVRLAAQMSHRVAHQLIETIKKQKGTKNEREENRAD